MTWEACYTQEVWDSLRAWAAAAERKKLVDVLVCQRFCEVLEKGGDHHAHAAALAQEERLKALPDHVLAEMVVDNAERVNSCSNGARELYLCQEGCGPHCVAVDDLCAARERELAEDRR